MDSSSRVQDIWIEPSSRHACWSWWRSKLEAESSSPIILGEDQEYSNNNEAVSQTEKVIAPTGLLDTDLNQAGLAYRFQGSTQICKGSTWTDDVPYTFRHILIILRRPASMDSTPESRVDFILREWEMIWRRPRKHLQASASPISFCTPFWLNAGVCSPTIRCGNQRSSPKWSWTSSTGPILAIYSCRMQRAGRCSVDRSW
jgi:hypothetical protein